MKSPDSPPSIQIALPAEVLVKSALLDTPPLEQAVSMLSQLSPLEQNVLRLLLQGHSDLEIANTIELAPQLVTDLTQALLARFQVSDRLELALKVLHHYREPS